MLAINMHGLILLRLAVISYTLKKTTLFNMEVNEMQLLKGTKREITLFQWNERLEKAKKSLEESKKCYELYHDEDSLQWIKEDEEKVKEIEKHIEEVIDYMDKHNIQ